MLTQDVSDLAAEDSEEFGGKLIMMGVQVCCPFRSVSYFLLSFTI